MRRDADAGTPHGSGRVHPVRTRTPDAPRPAPGRRPASTARTGRTAPRTPRRTSGRTRSIGTAGHWAVTAMPFRLAEVGLPVRPGGHDPGGDHGTRGGRAPLSGTGSPCRTSPPSPGPTPVRPGSLRGGQRECPLQLAFEVAELDGVDHEWTTLAGPRSRVQAAQAAASSSRSMQGTDARARHHVRAWPGYEERTASGRPPDRFEDYAAVRTSQTLAACRCSTQMAAGSGLFVRDPAHPWRKPGASGVLSDRALLRLRRTYAPADGAPEGRDPRRHLIRCRMVHRIEASCPDRSSPSTAMTEGSGY